MRRESAHTVDMLHCLSPRMTQAESERGKGCAACAAGTVGPCVCVCVIVREGGREVKGVGERESEQRELV